MNIDGRELVVGGAPAAGANPMSIRRGRILAVAAAILAACVSSCSTSRTAAPLKTPVSVQEGGATITMEPFRHITETVSPAALRCPIDAMKICRAYAGTAPEGASARTVWLNIPDGPSISIQCRYAGPGGALVSASPPAGLRLDTDTDGFLSAHGFCAPAPAPGQALRSNHM